MTFDEILEQVITLLKRQGRVSYRALKMRLGIDDECLDVLKEELLYVHPVIDDEGKGLIWTGDVESAQTVVPSPPPQTPQQPAAQETQPTDEISPETRPREAERRQLTVMFCDLVDSTKLSSQLDPEDYREVVREYQRVCSEVIQRYDGYIAQYLGDGLLVYFGYPVAHEEDAQRAIHTGLGIVEAIGNLNSRLEQDKGIRLAVRLGIHTGLVVVGEMGGVGRQEQLALGETPNIAARIQGIAEADTLVVSSSTYRLVQGYFEFQELGEQHLRGVSQPIPVYQVLQESGVKSRLDVASTRGLTPLVGREQETGILLERWAQAKDGQGQVILLSGEAGIGKSRLVQVLKDHVASEPHTRWECRSSPYYQNTALYPLIDLLQRALQWRQDAPPDERLEKLEHLLSQYRLPLEETVPLFAPLLSLSAPEDRYPPPTLSPQRQRQKTLETIVAILLELAEREPVLFILEDLHWTDPTTLEFLSLLVEQVPAAAISTLLTCRPHFQPSWHHRSYLTEITVNRLARDHIEGMAERVAGGKKLPAEVLQQIAEKTDGVPLFVEEMTKAVLEAGTLQEVNGQYELVGSLSSLAIPATLQDSLMARLDRLATAKGLAQQASVIGRQFSYELLQAVSQLDGATLQRELERLVDAELVYQRGLPPQATYMFKHALVQDIACQSLLRSTRQGYHQRIAQVLEGRFPESTETQPELLAHHFTEAGLHEQAVGYCHKAGQRAIEHSANVEAISHLKKGLELLSSLPETPQRLQQELDLQAVLGTALMVTKGYAAPEVEQVYTRAYTLCQQVEAHAQLYTVLVGLRRLYAIRGELQIAHEFAEQLLALAQKMHHQDYLLEAHFALGFTLQHQGLFVQACEHWEQVIALYDSQQHRALAFTYGIDPGVHCLIQSAMTLGFLGYVDQAVARTHDALTLAHALSHPFSLTLVLLMAAWVHLLRREWHQTQEYADAATTLATEQGFTLYTAWGTILRGWVLAMQGREEEGIAQLRQGWAASQATGARINQPRFLAMLVEADRNIWQSEEGLAYLSEAMATVEQTGERYYEAELHRLKGELLLQQSVDNQVEAETCFHQAISIAQRQQAKSWELRAATSLAKLWQRQGKCQEAYDLLAPVYGWFTEGFDTLDLKDAKALLEELA
jgi:predicted ATPase/class 3 adenylate cyclase